MSDNEYLITDDTAPELELTATPLTRARELAARLAANRAAPMGLGKPRLGITSGANQRAARLGIGSGLASRAARLGVGAVPTDDGEEQSA